MYVYIHGNLRSRSENEQFCVKMENALILFLSHRDVRRLVVAMSRARLGLYVFGRVFLFSNCFELTPTFNKVRIKDPQLII